MIQPYKIKITEKFNPESEHGEGVEHLGKKFYYRKGCRIPKDRVVHLTWEAIYNGVSIGDKEFLIVAYNPLDKSFWVLEHLFSDVRVRLKLYKNFNNQVAIKAAILRYKKIKTNIGV